MIGGHMKKVLALVLLALPLMSFSACGTAGEGGYPWDIGEAGSLERTVNDGVSLELAEGTLKPTGAEFYIRNGSGGEILVGRAFSLEIKLEGEWRLIELEEQGDWPLDALAVALGDRALLSLDWEPYYGELPAGAYRLVKEYVGDSSSARAFCEFEIY